MSLQSPLSTHDPLVTISDKSAIQQLGDAALLGNWFVFLKAEWLARSGMAQLLIASGIAEPLTRPVVLFRGKEPLTLPGAKIAPTPLPRPMLVSLTCDKALYRARRDTIRLLIAAPQHAKAELRLALQLAGNPYADYPVTLDEHGLCLWPLRDLPEGEYVAKLQGVEVGADECRFEVAEYRLAALNVELVEQHMSDDTLHYVLSISAFNQPYTDRVEVELQVRGQRVGKRTTLRCDSEGRCRGTVKLAGDGVHTLNVFAGERTASVVLKGAEQQRRETLTVSELGEERLLSMLPMPQSNTCRGMYISRGASNNEPFLVRRVIGTEVEIVARTDVELVRTVVVDPTRGTSEEQYHEQVKAEQVLRLPIPQPYGVVLLGAFIAGEAWEGWCAVLHPSDIRLECEAPKEAKPGSRITITIKTGQAERAIPVQLIVKDQRLLAPSDPQVEFAAAIKKNLTTWQKSANTGKIERQVMQMQSWYPYGAGGPMTSPMFTAPSVMMPMMSPGAPPQQAGPARGPSPMQRLMPRATGQMATARATPMALQESALTAAAFPDPAAAPMAQLATVRMQFPEIIHNSIVSVQGEATVQVKLGDSLTQYTVEAFALAAEVLDWQRAETTIQAVQPVYAEMTVSPFVFPGDVVMGRLDVGAASGAAIAEVRHDNEVLPLFFENGNAVTPGLPIPSGSVLRFPVRPGMFTATVRDARKGGVDVSERSVTAPGQLRHIMRRTHLLNPGEEVTLREAGVLELRLMPGLERPFQAFVEGVAMYPFGCIEQSSAKFMAMYVGYISNQHNEDVAQRYEAALVVWYKRIQSMYLPNRGFCFYPPTVVGARKPDTHYAPLAVKRLLSLPAAEHVGGQRRSIEKMLTSLRAMTQDAATYYKIESPPRNVSDCHAAYQVITSEKAKPQEKAKAAAFVRSRLKEHDGQTYVEVPTSQVSYRLWDRAVATREETAYAAAALFATKEPADLSRAIAATNYITGQMNEENRLYSTVDSAAALSLLIELRHTGLVTNGDAGKVLLNGREYSLREALSYDGQVESVRCIDGLIAIQVTSEVIENWRTFKGQLAVQVRLEKKGQIQQRFHVGDELELVIKVPQYEPGLIAHVCLPDALARIVGGGQVKRFSLDFCEKNELRVPLAAIGSTVLPDGAGEAVRQTLLDWFAAAGNGKAQAGQKGQAVQHWAVLVRNMFREEQIGNPGLLEVIVEA